MPTKLISSNIWSNPSRKVEVYYDVQNRTIDSVQIKLTFKYILNTSAGYSGYAAYVTPTIAGVKRSRITMKGASPSSWYGDPITVASGWYTVSAAYNVTSIKLSCLFSTTDPEDSNKTLSDTIPIADFKAASVFSTIPDFTFDSEENTGVPFSVPVTKYVASFYDVLDLYCQNSSATFVKIATRAGYSDTTVTLSADELELAYSTMQTQNSTVWQFSLTTYTDATMTTQVAATSSTTATGTISPTGRAPAFTEQNLSHKDVNTQTLAITGSTDETGYTFIKGYSSLQITALPATPHKGASIVSYTFTASGTLNTAGQSAMVKVYDMVTSNQYTVTVKDSRQNTTSVTVTIPEENWINYTHPTFTKDKVLVKRVEPDYTGTTLNLSIEGSFFDWGTLAQTNAIQTLQYRYKEASASDSSFSNWVALTPTANANGKFTYGPQNQSGEFALDQAYLFEFEAIDKLSSTSQPNAFTQTLQSAQPVLDINVEDNTLGVGEIFSGTPGVHSMSLKYAIKLGSALDTQSGGTGQSSLTQGAFLRGNGTEAVLMSTPQEAVEAMKSALVDAIYPVGSIYMSTSETSPQTLFGGTWEALEERFLLGAGTNYAAGTTGGAATHTLTVDEMPRHNHSVPNVKTTSSGSGATMESWGGGSGSRSVVTGAKGNGGAHNNMPPYLAVYMWKRTQ